MDDLSNDSASFVLPNDVHGGSGQPAAPSAEAKGNSNEGEKKNMPWTEECCHPFTVMDYGDWTPQPNILENILPIATDDTPDWSHSTFDFIESSIQEFLHDLSNIDSASFELPNDVHGGSGQPATASAEDLEKSSEDKKNMSPTEECCHPFTVMDHGDWAPQQVENVLPIVPDNAPDKWHPTADLNNINSMSFELPNDVQGDQPTVASAEGKGKSSKRKGAPWTEEEHRRFLVGLQKYGKGDWRSISRLAVISKTPAQVASHAQKYYLRLNSEKKRSSIHDVTIVEDMSLLQMPGSYTGETTALHQAPTASVFDQFGLMFE